MQTIERIDLSNNWLTLVFLLVFILLAVLKTLNHHKLFEYSRAFFLKGFIEKKVEERVSFFTAFNIVLFAFTIVVFSLFFSFLIDFFITENSLSFQMFFKTILFVFIYISVFLILDFVLSHLFEIKFELARFIASKLGYTYNIALLLFPFLILTTYSSLNISLLLSVFFMLFTLSIVLTFINNKNLIINKLFYFILYLCALEIAPLLIIYKITV